MWTRSTASIIIAPLSLDDCFRFIFVAPFSTGQTDKKAAPLKPDKTASRAKARHRARRRISQEMDDDFEDQASQKRPLATSRRANLPSAKKESAILKKRTGRKRAVILFSESEDESRVASEGSGNENTDPTHASPHLKSHTKDRPLAVC